MAMARFVATATRRASTLAPLGAVEGRVNFYDLSKEELAEHLQRLGLSGFRTKQLWHWVYQRGEEDFAKMTSLATDVRRLLADHLVVQRGRCVADTTSADGTRKWLLEFDKPSSRATGPAAVETVFIPEDDRGTACLSSQGLW